jgi:hypothetical protein
MLRYIARESTFYGLPTFIVETEDGVYDSEYATMAQAKQRANGLNNSGDY